MATTGSRAPAMADECCGTDDGPRSRLAGPPTETIVSSPALSGRGRCSRRYCERHVPLGDQLRRALCPASALQASCRIRSHAVHGKRLEKSRSGGSKLGVVELVFERRGAGEPLVLLHGIGMRWQSFAPVVDLLAREFEVWAVDMPGFGASPPASLPLSSIGRLTDEVQGWMRAKGLEGCHVAGNSTGGGVALTSMCGVRCPWICPDGSTTGVVRGPGGSRHRVTPTSLTDQRTDACASREMRTRNA